jgi:hypothetical protein
MSTFRPVTWNAERFNALRDACDDAVQIGQRKFKVDLDRKHKDFEFNTENALTIIAQLEADFAANPQPVFPENKEGPEP